MPNANIINAINLASRLHRSHVRHDSYDTPYISHLAAVAMYIQSVTDNENIIIAGLMHDALEDVADYEYENLLADCGPKVAQIVLAVTENKTLPYKDRKLNYLEKVKASGPESLAVSIADKIHNAYSYDSMPADKKHTGHSWLYNEILNIAKDKTQNVEYQFLIPLVKELEKATANII